MRLQDSLFSDALHGHVADADRLAPLAKAPARGIGRCLARPPLQNLESNLLRQRLVARWSRLVAQEPAHAGLGEPSLLARL